MEDPDLPPSDWSMQENKEDLVFPPIHHENLQIVSSPDYHTPSPTVSLSPFHSRLSAWILTLRSKLSSLRHRGPIWSFGFPAAALLFSFWILLIIRKKRILTPNEARLIAIINNKDRKIAQLLHQIAQMNQILIDRHKALAAKVAE
ncbi:hypothetical protein VNO78_23740 [Psophocarpus tetragonolobus]|uniref:Transmembrane protein n=1 Tax=Psophocarpus tetragonolobus TaxID=3891 RepID=A0AAN9S469_PSOTE